VAAALAISAQLAQPFWDADLQRLDGDLVLAAGGAPEEAAARYQQALDIARAQEAKSFERRAATSLARLWRDQDKRTEARDLLAPLYAWSTEGFDTGDLKDARRCSTNCRDRQRCCARSATTTTPPMHSSA
jgi:predicted ATPase